MGIDGEDEGGGTVGLSVRRDGAWLGWLANAMCSASHAAEPQASRDINRELQVPCPGGH